MFEPSATYKYFCCGSLDKRHVERRPVAKRVLGDECLLDVCAVRLEHLDAIVGAIADVQQAVVRERDAVHRSAELLGWRIARVVWRKFRVVGLVAVCAPVPLVFACVRIEDDHPAVAVAVGHIQFVGLRVDQRLRRQPQIVRIVAALALIRLADLHQELAGLRELQEHAVVHRTGRRHLAFIGCEGGRLLAAAVAADPDVAFVVDVDAVVR